jgi:hypothetical protein
VSVTAARVYLNKGIASPLPLASSRCCFAVIVVIETRSDSYSMMAFVYEI